MCPFGGTFFTIFYMQVGEPPCKICNLPCNLHVKLGLCNLHQAILASTRRRGGRRVGKEGGPGQEIGWGIAKEGGAGREAEDGMWETQVRGTKRGCKRTPISTYKHTKPMQRGQ
jgi:hypothetical protein